MAGALVKLLAPACERIEIGGSIRRQKSWPNDIEIVAVPVIATFAQSTLFGGLLGRATSEQLNLLDERCDELLYKGILKKRPDSQGRHC
jgi:hypothetical protein